MLVHWIQPGWKACWLRCNPSALDRLRYRTRLPMISSWLRWLHIFAGICFQLLRLHAPAARRFWQVCWLPKPWAVARGGDIAWDTASSACCADTRSCAGESVAFAAGEVWRWPWTQPPQIMTLFCAWRMEVGAAMDNAICYLVFWCFVCV